MCKPWIKITRDFVTHPYFRNPVCLQFFLYLVAQANPYEQDGVQRGCVTISVWAYARDYGVPERSVRDVIKSLIADGAIQVVSTSRRSGTTFRVCNYDKYQYTPKDPSPRTEPRTEIANSPRTENEVSPRTEKSPKLPLSKSEVRDTKEELPRTENESSPRTENEVPPRTEPRTLTHARYKDRALVLKEEYKEEEILSYESTKKAACAASRPEVARPSLDDVMMHAACTGVRPEVAEQFFWYYESRGWSGSNGTPIRSWQAALRLWLAREAQYQKRNNHETTYPNRADPASSREQARQARRQTTLALVQEYLQSAANSRRAGADASTPEC